MIAINRFYARRVFDFLQCALQLVVNTFPQQSYANSITIQCCSIMFTFHLPLYNSFRFIGYEIQNRYHNALLSPRGRRNICDSRVFQSTAHIMIVIQQHGRCAVLGALDGSSPTRPS